MPTKKVKATGGSSSYDAYDSEVEILPSQSQTQSQSYSQEADDGYVYEEEEDDEEQGEDQHDDDDYDGDVFRSHEFDPGPSSLGSKAFGSLLQTALEHCRGDIDWTLMPCEVYYKRCAPCHVRLRMHKHEKPVDIKLGVNPGDTSKFTKVEDVKIPSTPPHQNAALCLLLDTYLPKAVAAEGNVDTFCQLVQSGLNAIYHERNAMRENETIIFADASQLADDARRVTVILTPAIKTKNLAMRVIKTISLIMDNFHQMCIICGRHDHQARGALEPSDRPHACHAELCLFISTTTPHLIHAADEKLKTITSAAARDNFLLSYAPVEYTEKKGGKTTIDYEKLKRDLSKLARLQYKNMKKSLKKKKNEIDDDEDYSEAKLLSFFEKTYPREGRNMYLLYYWVLRCYHTCFRVVPQERIYEYVQERGFATVPGLNQTITSILNDIPGLYGEESTILETLNDRSRRRLAFEDLIARIKKQGQGPRPLPLVPNLGLSLHGSPKHKWHSILQNGVMVLSGTRHMSTGAAFGSGVYSSTNLGTSYGYAGNGDGHIAICEYLTNDGRTNFMTSSNPHVVVSNENAVAIKFVLIRHKAEENEEADDDDDDDEEGE